MLPSIFICIHIYILLHPALLVLDFLRRARFGKGFGKVAVIRETWNAIVQFFSTFVRCLEIYPGKDGKLGLKLK